MISNSSGRVYWTATITTLLLIGTSWSCERSSKPAAPTPPACIQEAAALATWLQGLEQDGFSNPHNSAIDAPVPTLSSLLVEVGPDYQPPPFSSPFVQVMYTKIVGSKDPPGLDITFNGEFVGSLDKDFEDAIRSLHWRLQVEVTMRQKVAKENPGLKLAPQHLELRLTRDVPWSAIAAISEVARKLGYERLWPLFRRRPHVTTPRPSARIKAQGGWDYAYGARIFQHTDILPQVTEKCPQVRRLLDKPGAHFERGDTQDFETPPLLTHPAIINELPGAIESCHCKVNMDELKLVMSSLAGRPTDSLVGTVSIVLGSPDKHVKALRADADTLWREAHERVLTWAKDHPDEPVLLELTDGPSPARASVATIAKKR